MENADRLCGITMEEPGVSKLVAVNLRNTRMSPATPGPAPMPPRPRTEQFRAFERHQSSTREQLTGVSAGTTLRLVSALVICQH
jgi:hypothetical protein